MSVKVKSDYKIEYQTPGACAFDFQVKDTTTIEPGRTHLIDTGVVVKVPEGTALLVLERSSTHKKFGVSLANKVGLIDQDYCGDNDTVKLALINTTKESVTLNAWDRVAQGLFVQIVKPEFIYVDKMNEEDRGGFGTTGVN